MEEKNIYYKRLDYVRIISCILVLFYHLNIIKGGFLAVCTFFTLSGYLVCASALEKRNFSIKLYYINKLKKIYLPLIMVVSITIISAKIFSNIKWINLKPETISVILGYNNFWQLNANLDYFTRHINSPFIHLWYIAILMQLDLIFPIGFLILKKIDKNFNYNVSVILVVVLLVILTVIFYYMSNTKEIMIVYYNTIYRSFSFIFGICLALIHSKYRIKFSQFFREYNKVMFYMYISILILLCLFVSYESKNYAIYMILTTIICAKIIRYSIIDNKKIEKKNIILNFISQSTYEIYLIQYPVLFFMQSISISSSIKTLIIIILTFIISIYLHFIINISLKDKFIIIIKWILICLTIFMGICVLLSEKDYSDEMKELEERLNDNLKIIEQKNNEIQDTIIISEENEELNDNNEFNNNIVEEEINNFNEIDGEKIDEIVRNLNVVGIGDSVLLDTIDELYKLFPNGYFDGKISRSITSSKELILDLKNKGKLGEIVILALATNGDYSEKKNKELMEILENREVYWINAVGADDQTFNEKFRNFASNYPNIHLVEWDVTAKDHPEYFYADGIHVKGKGIKVYADTIYNTIYNHYLEVYSSQ